MLDSPYRDVHERGDRGLVFSARDLEVNFSDQFSADAVGGDKACSEGKWAKATGRRGKPGNVRR
jgi:hypothetical protein